MDTDDIKTIAITAVITLAIILGGSFILKINEPKPKNLYEVLQSPGTPEYQKAEELWEEGQEQLKKEHPEYFDGSMQRQIEEKTKELHDGLKR